MEKLLMMRRNNRILSGLRIALLAGCALLLAACNDSDPSTANLSGTAATGAPFDGIVYVQDVLGMEVNTATDPATGDWSVSVGGMTAPFLVKAVPNGVGDTLYSYAATANLTANITPLSSLALFLAMNNNSLDDLYTNWVTNHSQLTAQTILNEQAVINANFAAEMTAVGLDHTTFDIIADAFNADGTGFDALLDDLLVVIDADTYTITFNGVSFFFNEAIDTSGINLGGGNGGGNGTATINVYDAFGITDPDPGVGLGSITVSSVTDASSGNSSLPNQRRIEVTGTNSSKPVTVQIYYDSTNGSVSNMSYQNLNDGIVVFCDTTNSLCNDMNSSSVSVNVSARTAMFDVNLTDVDGIFVTTATQALLLSGNVSF
jgi:hypothetical protein